MKNSTLPWRALGACWAVLLFASSAAPSQTLTLSGVQPFLGEPGDDVELVGEGFDMPAASYFAWGFDGSRGFVLDVRQTRSPTHLDAVVADVHVSTEGPIVLWEGWRKPVEALDISNGFYGIRNGYTFVPTEEAQGPSFHVLAGSTPGYAGQLVDGEIHLDLAVPIPQTAQDGQRPIRAISVLVGGVSCGPPDGSEDKAYRWASIFEIECLLGPCDGQLSDLLVGGLAAVLGEHGVQARAEGSTVILSGLHPFCSGFLDVTSPDLAKGRFRLRQNVGALASRRDRSSAASSR